MKKENVIFIAALVLIVGFAFYWFQVRPSMIRHSCSWVLHHTDPRATQGTPLTKEQVATNQKYTAMTWAARLWAVSMADSTSDIGKLQQINDNNFIDTGILYPDTYVPAQPATNWWGQASDEQYRFCVQDKGL